MKRYVAATAVVISGFVLAGCSEINSAVDQASNLTNKASVCAEALGIADININVDPQQLQQQAAEKAQKLRDLANQAPEPDVQQALSTMANSYVELEKKQAEHLGNLNDWVQRSMNNLNELKNACI